MLDWHSNHPAHTKMAIVYSQALVVYTTCSNSERAEFHLNNLRTKFISSNYPTDIIQQQFLKASKVNRADLIWKVRNKERKKLHSPFIYTYNSKCPPWRKWFQELKYILDLDERLTPITNQIKFITKQPKNLRQLCTSAKVRGPSKPLVEEGGGSHKCGRNCHTCAVVRRQSSFRARRLAGLTQLGKTSTVRQSGLFIYFVARSVEDSTLARAKMDLARDTVAINRT